MPSSLTAQASVSASRDLDDTDTRILDILRRDGRVPGATIAKAVGLSKTAVKYRIERLQRIGVIKGFFALVDSGAYDRTVSVVFDLMVRPMELQRVAKHVAKFKEVVRTYELSSSPELHVHALFRDQLHMQRFMRQKLYAIEGITDVKTGIISQRYKVDVTLTV